MHDPSYWSALYASGRAPAEWFVDPDELYDVICDTAFASTEGLTDGTYRVLDVGCGTSSVGVDIIRKWPAAIEGGHGRKESCATFTSCAVVVDAIDFAATAVQRVTSVHSEFVKSGTLYVHELDVLHPDGLPFTDERYNLVLDKGTLDAIVHGFSDDQRDAAVGKALGEVNRVAAPHCALVHVSDEPPELRMPILAAGLGDWLFSWREVGSGYTAFAYTGRKGK